MINDESMPTVDTPKINDGMSAHDAWTTMYRISDEVLLIDGIMKIIRKQERMMGFLNKNPRVWGADDDYVVARGRTIAEAIAASVERRTHDTPIPADVLENAIRVIDAMIERIDDDNGRAIELTALLYRSAATADGVRAKLIKLRDADKARQRRESPHD